MSTTALPPGPPSSTPVGVEGVDHAGSIVSPRGAEATAAPTREALA